MLSQKASADRISPLDERIVGVFNFARNLAPGMKNWIRCIPISNAYGPPGQLVDSRAYPSLANNLYLLVLSHEMHPLEVS